MFEFVCVARRIAALAVIFLFSTNTQAHYFVSGDSSTSSVYPNKVSKADAKDRLTRLSTVIDINITDEVQSRIQQYTYYHRSSAENILGKVLSYFPVFEAEIRRRGLPDDLKYLAVVESLLNPHATSKSGAAGLWQFTKGTGKMVGLEVNSVVDQRRSIEKSTIAAMDYLQALYDRFGDWNLALAAYNCGPGNVAKALKRSGGSSYWQIRNFLPKETQKYLPRFIAAMYLLNYYHYHDLQPNLLHSDFYKTTTVNVKGSLKLSEVAKTLNMEVPANLALLNPEYSKGYIPKGSGQYTLRIPSYLLESYYRNYDKESYNSLLTAREERRKERLLKLQREEEELKSKLVVRDSMKALQEIVTLIYNSIQSTTVSKPEYNIPRRMHGAYAYHYDR